MADIYPIYTNGIGRLCMSKREPDPSVPEGYVETDLPKNTFTFTTLAASVNLGMKILETAAGQSALTQLGINVANEWLSTATPFAGDINYMANYVEHFLSRLRENFANVVDEDIGGPHILASSSRLEYWDGNHADFQPKLAISISYNHCRVMDMARAFDKSHGSSSEAKKLRARYRRFMFLFGVATAHELCHAFVGYLAQNADTDDFPTTRTPLQVDHLTYGKDQSNGEPTGEAGRWVENRIFGGAIEAYVDVREGHHQSGVPYIIDATDLAWKIKPEEIDSFVRELHNLSLPMQTVGHGKNPQQRIQLGLRPFKIEDMTGERVATYMAARKMIARHEGPQLEYNVTRKELERIAGEMRLLKI